MLLHLPTFFLIVGFPVIWLEIFVFDTSYGQTSIIAPVLILLLFLYMLYHERLNLARTSSMIRQSFLSLSFNQKGLFLSLCGLVFVIALITINASFYPPHLLPETDVLNYHYTLPRQHLIQNNFSHLPWSVADLFPLPTQFALSPYWFATYLPNKIPQLFFTLSLWGLIFQTTFLISHRKSAFLAGSMACFAFIGSHGFAVQYGTAMMDLVFCYLFMAALHSFLTKRTILFGIESAFFVWAKFPLMYLAILITLISLILIFKHVQWRFKWGFDTDKFEIRYNYKAIFVTFTIATIIIAGPFWMKSLRYAGTPLFPFWTGTFKTVSHEYQERIPAIKKASDILFSVVKAGKDDRSLKGFLSHFFILSVPTKGVNNPFDYPLGLPYLLFLLPFFVFTIESIRKRIFPVLAVLVVLFWGAWWFSSHQARFLYVPVALIFILCSSNKKIIQSQFIWLALAVGLGLTSISMIRGHKKDFGKGRWETLRLEDKQLVEMGKNLKEPPPAPIELNRIDAAYATFPVDIRIPYGAFVLHQE
jgi:heme exporter protein D